MNLLTVVIPTYNRENSTSAAIKSVLGNPSAELEVIVVDDCSIDGTLRKITEIQDKRLKVLGLAENVGVCAARNAGALAASGEWLAFLDSDDELIADKIPSLLELLKSASAEVDGIYSRRLHDYGGITPATLKDKVRLDCDNYLSLIEQNYFSGCDVFSCMRKGTFSMLPWPSRRVPELEYHIEFASTFNLIGVPDVFYLCRHGEPNQLTKAVNSVAKAEHELERVDSYRRILTSNADALLVRAPKLRKLMVERCVIGTSAFRGRAALVALLKELRISRPWPRYATLILLGLLAPKLTHDIRMIKARSKSK